MFLSCVNDTGDKEKNFEVYIFFIFVKLGSVHFTPKDRIFAHFSYSGAGKLILAGLSNLRCC
jgi:hypothetical protein